MFSRKRAQILDKYDASVRKVQDVNRGVGKKVKRAFWDFGLADAYYKALERFGKVVESIGFFFGFIWHIILSATVHSNTADSIRKAGDNTAKKVNRSWEDLAQSIAEKAEKSIFTGWLVKLLRLARHFSKPCLVLASTGFGLAIFGCCWARSQQHCLHCQ